MSITWEMNRTRSDAIIIRKRSQQQGQLQCLAIKMVNFAPAGTQLTGMAVEELCYGHHQPTVNDSEAYRRPCMPNNTVEHITGMTNAQTVGQLHTRDTSAGGNRRGDRITHSGNKENKDKSKMVS